MAEIATQSSEADLAAPANDWVLGPFDATRRSPLWVGGALLILLIGLSLLFRLIADDSFVPESLHRDPYFWTDVLSALILAYLATAYAIQRRGVLRDLSRLRPLLRRPSGERLALLQEVVGVERRSLAAAGLIGGCVLGALPVVDPSYWIHGRPALSDPTLLFVSLRNFATGWIAGHAILTEIHVTRGYARLGAYEMAIDLLDLEPLRIFARKGQRGAIVWLLCSSLVSAFWLGPTGTESNVPILFVTLALVTLVFVAPIYGAHRGIHQAKQAKLTELGDELRQLERDRRHDDPAHNTRLAAVAALHGLTAGVREWPVDTPALLRVGFFALLGLGSWFGSALVERWLDVAFG